MTSITVDGHDAKGKPPAITTLTNQRERLWLEVIDFLKSLTFDEYINVFQSEGFDRMDAIYDLTMDDLREMKIKRGHAKIILQQIEQYKANKAALLSPSKKVRFGDNGGASTYSSDGLTPTAQSFVVDNSSNQFSQSSHHNINNNNNYLSTKSNLPIVDETKNDSPNGYKIPPKRGQNGMLIHHLNGYNNSSSSQNYSGSQNTLINNYSSSTNDNNGKKQYYHATINQRGNKSNLQTPTSNNHQSDSSHQVLMRSVSARSDGSELEYSHTNDAQYPYKLQSQKSYKSYTHSPHHSFSDAGTVVIRQSVIDPNEEHDTRSIYSHNSFNGMSPAMEPIVVDMHNDLNSLIDSLHSAKCINNSNYDEYHEALVSVTTNWDRNKSESTLKYMNARDNYNNYVILDLLGVLNAQLGRTEDAIKYHTDSISSSNSKYIEAMHNYAYLLHRIGDKENDLLSIKYYKMALSINKSFAHCWLHYGNLLEDDGKLRDAVSMYKKAILIRPRNAAFHLDLANVLDDLNEFEEACLEYLKCIELQPNDPVYHWNYAISLENQCFYYKAEEAYKTAINLDFNCIDAHINYAHMLENQPTPQYRMALKQYELLLKIPEMINNTEILLKCAKLYEHFGENEKTELLYMNLLQIDPTIEEIYILFARYLTNQNRIEDANACYQAGIRHIQTQKLQEHYIQFLKDINNIYNNIKTKNNNSKKNTFKQKLTNINTSNTTSTTTTTTTSSSLSTSTISSSYNHRPQTSAYNNKQYVPPSPFVTSIKAPTQFPSNIGNNNNNNNGHSMDYDDMGFDYYKPAKNRESGKINTKNTNINGNNKNNKKNNNNNNKSKTTVTANGDDPGCIVM